jgi:HPt (histidine-containing phosphotransfer) domain-containing protein
MIIDTSVLDAYRDFMEEDADDFIRDVLDDFYENSQDLLKTLATLPNEDGLDEFVRAAHTLKSTSATVGATKLSELAASIEQKGKDNAIANIPPLLVQLAPAYAEAEAKLKEIYK